MYLVHTVTLLGGSLYQIRDLMCPQLLAVDEARRESTQVRQVCGGQALHPVQHSGMGGRVSLARVKRGGQH